ncbi:MAG: efflux RND transporter periplasmic adaptor subunit [bacterium]
MRVRWAFAFITAALVVSVAGLPSPTAAQGRGPSPVVVVPVETKVLEATVTLVGTVHPATRSLIASETEGLVVCCPAEEGQSIRKGQLLAQLRRVPIDLKLREARAARQRTEAEHTNARREAARRKDLYEQGVIAIEEYQVTATSAQAAAERVAEAQAVVARLEDELAQTSITAPFDGVVVKEHTEVGQWLNRGDPVVELLDLSTVDVIVPVPERHIAQVRRGEAASLILDALPGRSFTGQVSQVIPQANAESRTFPIKVQVANPDGLIKSGMFARVTLPVGRGRRALAVPKDALVSHGPVDLLFIVSDGMARQVAVKRGQATGNWVAIEGPVTEGQLVVVRGNERLRDGMPVTILPPNKAGATAGDGTQDPR